MRKCLICGNNRKKAKFCSKKCYGKYRSSINTIDENTLHNLYINQNKSSIEIANELNVSVTTVCKYLKKFKIELTPNYEDFTNKVIGDLTVIKLLSNTGSGKHARWLVRCKCGNEYETSSSTIKISKTNQCKKCIGKNRRSQEPIKNCHFISIKKRAIDGNIEFNLTKEFLWDLFLKQNKKCALTGLDLKFGETARLYNINTTASLDRIDSNKGYVEENVQWLHKDINLMKMGLNQDKFIEYCELITDWKNVRNTKITK